MVSKIFYFHPFLGKMNPFWRAYFSDGWFNHQLVGLFAFGGCLSDFLYVTLIWINTVCPSNLAFVFYLEPIFRDPMIFDTRISWWGWGARLTKLLEHLESKKIQCHHGEWWWELPSYVYYTSVTFLPAISAFLLRLFWKDEITEM